MQPLFVYAGANLHLADMWAYAPVAGAYVLARTLAKTLTVYGCGLAFGYEHKQAVSTGLLLVPMAGLAIGLVQTTTTLMPELGAQMSVLVLAAVAVFETVGPPIAAYALRLSGDAGKAAHGFSESAPAAESTPPPTLADLVSATAAGPENAAATAGPAAAGTAAPALPAPPASKGHPP